MFHFISPHILLPATQSCEMERKNEQIKRKSQNTENRDVYANKIVVWSLHLPYTESKNDHNSKACD